MNKTKKYNEMTYEEWAEFIAPDIPEPRVKWEQQDEWTATRLMVVAEMKRCREMCPDATRADLMVMCANHLNWNLTTDINAIPWMQFALDLTYTKGA